MSKRIVIAEDFRMIRGIFENAVKNGDDYILAGSFPTAAEAVDFVRTSGADLVIMDVLIPGSISGLEAAKEIKSFSPSTKIMIVTSMPEYTYTKRAREIGVESFWLKEVQEQPLEDIIRRTLAGESVYPSSRPIVPLGDISSADLTEREMEILKELVSGASNKEIADKLFIETGTVKMHISNMLQKTGFHSRLELAVKARHCGLVIGD